MSLHRKRSSRLWTVIPLTAVIAIAAAALFHQANRPVGEITPRLKCASNLHVIGLAITLYQNDNADHYPPSMAEIVGMGLFSQDLICRDSSETAAEVSKPTTRQAADFLATPGHCSYVYVGHAYWTAKSVPDDAVVAYDPPAHHDGHGSVILFGDGHSEWVESPRADRLIKAASATTQPVSAAKVP